MRLNAMVICAVLIAIVLLLILVAIPHQPLQDITVRHVGSVQSSNVIVMTFEIKNHTADSYIFSPFRVQIRKGNTWTTFQQFNAGAIHPIPTVDPTGLSSYTLNVTNLPSGAIVRFVIRPQKVLMGVNGFVRRAELKVKNRAAGGGPGAIPLNPFDRNSKVFGLPTEVASEEFVQNAE